MKFERVRYWCTDAQIALAETFNGDLDRIRANVDAGYSELWKLDSGRSWMVTRIDGDILTVCCYQGRGLAHDAALILDAAKNTGMRSVDFIAKSKGLARLLRSLSPRELGTIFTVDVA